MDYLAAVVVELSDEAPLSRTEKERIQLDDVHHVWAYQRLDCRGSRVHVVDERFVDLTSLGAIGQRLNQCRGLGAEDAEKDAAALRQIAQRCLRRRQPATVQIFMLHCCL